MGVKYLLDSHVFLWLATTPERVAEQVRAELVDPGSELEVSPVSAFEFSMKQRLGKFSSPIVERWDEAMKDLRATHRPLTSRHGLLAGRLRWEHKDPFDRLIAAQAILEGLTLVTVDRAFASAPGISVLTW